MNKVMNRLPRIRLTILCCACAISATVAGTAEAGPPGRGGHGAPIAVNRFNHFSGRGAFGGSGFAGGGFGGWGAWGGELFGYELTGNEYAIPYFALHPPVYYSYPIARPYGDSPFAYPPGLFTSTATDGGPQMIVNPYATPGNGAPSDAAPSNAKPSNANPAPPAPSNPSPTNSPKTTVKPTAGRTASLITLPSPEPTSLAATAASKVHVVLNPFVR